MCFAACTEGVRGACSAKMNLRLDVDGLVKHHEHLGACNPGGREISPDIAERAWSCFSKQTVSISEPHNMLVRHLSESRKRSKDVKLQTEAQSGTVYYGMPKSPASVMFRPLSVALEAVDVLSMSALLPYQGGIHHAFMIDALRRLSTCQATYTDPVQALPCSHDRLSSAAVLNHSQKASANSVQLSAELTSKSLF
ncbi:hypothetical protein AUEXF2481DRAFT_29402 [Aureobasidium subglaciale EXF-2481]|uniref:Uncharacterized protein n=1 Tax=Aureobasidium subglaciale (strain EXF-2481) TaxID=1043005 RepID=A0A074Z906_AURSE|nr:uncharacterized protein AUEXF2481DRAFT_29402 [Aureobasidium subglaciale EXF-2481]KEQ95316.1 hypothetical protein AUEXF2481DRAFT_29402 [Aureobasidium subglaciale EXF-2481]